MYAFFLWVVYSLFSHTLVIANPLYTFTPCLLPWIHLFSFFDVICLSWPRSEAHSAAMAYVSPACNTCLVHPVSSLHTSTRLLNSTLDFFPSLTLNPHIAGRDKASKKGTTVLTRHRGRMAPPLLNQCPQPSTRPLPPLHSLGHAKLTSASRAVMMARPLKGRPLPFTRPHASSPSPPLCSRVGRLVVRAAIAAAACQRLEMEAPSVVRTPIPLAHLPWAHLPWAHLHLPWAHRRPLR